MRLAEPVPDQLLVWGQQRLLTRMLENLVANACRFATERVLVTLAVGGPGLTITVDDDGPGIPETQRERVFERFVRLDESRGGEGFGLGLSIVQAVALRHGGTARLEACDGGAAGARLVVRLPAPGDAPQGRAARIRSRDPVTARSRWRHPVRAGRAARSRSRPVRCRR